MELISLTFLGFLAAVVAVTRLPIGALPKRVALLIFNLGFLASFDWLAPVFFLGTSLWAFAAARIAARGISGVALGAMLSPLLAPLFVPKLGLFDAAGATDAAGNVLGTRLLLFIGASYFTLRALHFVIDAHRKRKLTLPLFDYLVWNSFFPTIVAGPIERADHFAKTYERLGRADGEDWGEGLKRIYFGLLKKVVFGHVAWAWAQPIWGYTESSQLGFFEAWGALYAMCLFAYLDFAGYSDIAIGCARLLGIKVAENFDNPYLRPSISEFWQGWHISLSTWIRDYLFLPMCGRSRSLLRPHIAALGSMTLCGLWHAPQLGWVLWGLAHGAGLSAHQAWMLAMRKRFALKKKLSKSKTYRVFATLLTFHFVALTWVLISIDATDLSLAWRYFGELLGLL